MAPLRVPLLVGILFCMFVQKSDSACTFGVTPGGNSDSFDSNQDTQYIMTSPSFSSSCCGVLSSISYYPRRKGNIQFQIWRNLITNFYTLIGEFSYYTPTTGSTLTVTAPGNISVQTGDFIGWYTSGNDIIKYKSGSSKADGNVILIGYGDVTPGSNYSLSIGYTNDRSYAIEVSVSDGNNPDFVNLPATINIYDHSPVGTSIFQVEMTDVNTGDIPYLALTIRSQSGTLGTQLSVNTTSGVITVSDTLYVGTYNIRFRATDPCRKIGEKILSINILNHAPVINNLPSSVDVSESTTIETHLYNISVSDASGDLVLCNLSATTPPTSAFILKFLSASQTYGVYVVSNPGLSFATNPSYQLDILCSDKKDTVVEQLHIYVLKNEAPVFTNLPNVTSFTSTTSVGTVIFQTSATDKENGGLYFSVAPSCTSCIVNVGASGNVILGASLVGTAVTHYNIDIQVTDGTNTATSTLTVVISDLNNAPVINNLPRELTLPETQAVGSTVFTLSVTDLDDDPVSYQLTFSPVSGAAKFNLDTASRGIRLANTLDYESGIREYNITIIAFDGALSSTPGTLNIQIIDVNEPPVFDKNLYTISRSETNAGHSFPSPGASVTDPDVSDTFTFKIIGGDDSTKFVLNPNTGIVSFAVHYDLEAGYPSNLTWIIAAVDSGGLSGTATLVVNVVDNNDNTPEFQQTTKTVQISNDVGIGSSIADIQATDADVSELYSSITYSIDQSHDYEYFRIGTKGELFTAKSFSSLTDATLKIFVRATDVNNRQSAAEVLVVVRAPVSKSFAEDPGNFVWITSVILAVAAVAMLLVAAIYRRTTNGFIFCKKWPDILKPSMGSSKVSSTWARKPPPTSKKMKSSNSEWKPWTYNLPLDAHFGIRVFVSSAWTKIVKRKCFKKLEKYPMEQNILKQIKLRKNFDIPVNDETTKQENINKRQARIVTTDYKMHDFGQTLE